MEKVNCLSKVKQQIGLCVSCTLPHLDGFIGENIRQIAKFYISLLIFWELEQLCYASYSEINEAT